MGRHVRRNLSSKDALPRFAKVFLVSAGLLSIVLAAGAGWSARTLVVVNSHLSDVRQCTGKGCTGPGALQDVDPVCEKTCNFLILGSDSRAGLTKKQQEQYGTTDIVKSQRSDTIIVVRFDSRTGKTVVLHIPRDLWVDIPGVGEGKINSAFEQGRNKVVQTVEKLTGLNINHYVQINFVGFIDLVNVMGGVPICIDQPMVDTLAGLNLAHRGCYNLSGQQALAFVRARHVQGDVIPDFSRIARQQQFMRAVLAKILSPGEVLNVEKLVDAAKDNLAIDDGLSLVDLHDLTNELARVGQEDVTFRVVPSVPAVYNGIDILRLVEPDADMLFKRLRLGHALGRLGKEEPGLPISPAQVVVQIYDAGDAADARAVEQYLTKAGYVVLPVRTAPQELTSSRILYGSGFAKQANSVASYLPRVPLLFDETHTAGATVTVVIAPDFKGID